MSTATLNGQRFGSLVVERDSAPGGVDRRVCVVCDCGQRSSVLVRHLYANRQRCSVAGCTARRRAQQKRAAS